MRFAPFALLASTLLLAVATPAVAANPRIHRGPTSPRLFKERTRAAAPRPTASIDSERATQLQSALIKAGYLTGEPSGLWDTSSQAAMQKLQADNGWQTKLVPDSRAIIKLGLGPNNTGTPDLEASETSATAEPAPAAPANQ